MRNVGQRYEVCLVSGKLKLLLVDIRLFVSTLCGIELMHEMLTKHVWMIARRPFEISSAFTTECLFIYYYFLSKIV